MRKYTKTIVISAILTAFVIIAPSFASAQLNLDDGAIDPIVTPTPTITPCTGNCDDVDVTPTPTPIITNPPCTGNCDDVDVTPTPTPIVTNPPCTGNCDDGIQPTPTPTPVVTPTPTPTPAPIVYSGSSSGSSRVSTTTLPFYLGAGACSYLNSYLKIGAQNDPMEVLKLQNFLRTEGINVDVNGLFDNKTFEGVRNFQAKYLADIMGPWGSSNPTGFVFYTTQKKINEIYCRSNFALTPAQLAEITAYRNGVRTNPQIIVTPVSVNEVEATPSVSPSVTPIPEIGSNTNTNGDETAAAGSTSFGQKISNFFKWLFGY